MLTKTGQLPSAFWQFQWSPKKDLNRVLSTAAAKIDRRSFQYILDVGPTHAVFSHGEADRPVPIALSIGTSLPETQLPRTVHAAIAEAGAPLARGQTTALPSERLDTLLPAEIYNRLTNALRWEKDKTPRAFVSRLHDETLVCHSVFTGSTHPPYTWRFGVLLGAIAPIPNS